MWLRFVKLVCQNERIRTLRWGVYREYPPPPKSAIGNRSVSANGPLHGTGYIFEIGDINGYIFLCRIDSYMMKRLDQTGFIPPGRPKRWRQKCFQVLEDAIQAK